MFPKVEKSSPTWKDLAGCLHQRNENFVDKVNLFGRRFALLFETGKFFTTDRVIDFVENKLEKESDQQTKLSAYREAKSIFNTSIVELSESQQIRVSQILSLREAAIANNPSTQTASAPPLNVNVQSPVSPLYEEPNDIPPLIHAPKKETEIAASTARRSILIQKRDAAVGDDLKLLKESLLELKKELEEYDEKILPPLTEGTDLEASFQMLAGELTAEEQWQLVDVAADQVKNLKAFQKDKDAQASHQVDEDKSLSESFLSASLLKKFEAEDREARAKIEKDSSKAAIPKSLSAESEKEQREQDLFIEQLRLTSEYVEVLKHDFDIQRSKDDGNCFFYSLASQVKEGVNKDNLFQKMMEVRQEVTEYMRNNAETFQFMLGIEDPQEFEDYLEDMAAEKTWGSALEAYAASNLYGRTIELYIPPTPDTPASPGKPVRSGSPATVQEMKPNEPGESSLPPVMLLYNGANHWDWLKPKGQNGN